MANFYCPHCDTRQETHTFDNNTERSFFFSSSDIRLATLIPEQQSLYIHDNSTERGLLFVCNMYVVFVNKLLRPSSRHDNVYMHFWYIFLFIWPIFGHLLIFALIWPTLAFVPLFGPFLPFWFTLAYLGHFVPFVPVSP